MAWVNIRGIDSASAETNFGGDIDFYRELVETFIASTPPVLTQIETLLASDARDELRHEVHKLRGQLGTLGAMAYRDKAGVIESALVDGFTYQIDLEELLIYLRELLADMQAWIAQPPDS